MGKHICNDGAILRNEPIAVPDDSGRGLGTPRGTPLDPRPPRRGLAGRASLTPATRLLSPAMVLTFNHPSKLKPAPRPMSRLGSTRRRGHPLLPWKPPRTRRNQRTDPRARPCVSRAAATATSRIDATNHRTLIRATVEPPPTVTPCEQAICDDDAILRNKAIAAPDDLPNRDNDNPAGLAGSIASGGNEERAQDDACAVG